jgi:HEAT repeat protein
LKDPDAEVRSKAIDGLWESEDSSLINTLVDLLDHDRSQQVQKAAAIGLGKFAILAEHNKLRPSYTNKIAQALLNTIYNNNKSQEVRRQALAAAAPMSYPWVKDAINKAYQSDDKKLKNIAIYSMGKNCDNAWLPTLLNELSSNDFETRYEAAIACGEMGEEEAIPKLIELTNDHDIEVSLASVQALGEIGGFRAKSHLQRCLKNPSKVIQEAAKQALERLVTLADPLSFEL